MIHWNFVLDFNLLALMLDIWHNLPLSFAKFLIFAFWKKKTLPYEYPTFVKDTILSNTDQQRYLEPDGTEEKFWALYKIPFIED